MMRTIGTLCSGGGLVDRGAAAAGLAPLWAVEYDAAIAAVAQHNAPDTQVIVSSVQDMDYRLLPRVDVLHASPPCPQFSAANASAGETDNDRAIAHAIARAIATIRPRLVTLENVRGYLRSESIQIVTAALLALDYAVETIMVNAADYGVPQTRVRMVLIARAGGWMRAPVTLPASTPWHGWHQAVADLLPALPTTQFAAWQRDRLPKTAAGSFMATNNKAQYGDGIRDAAEPAFTVTAQSNARCRAFLVDSQNTSRAATVRRAGEPAMTMTASAARHGMPRAWLETGRVVMLSVRALARLQAIDDAYWLPASVALAGRIVGNAVPPLLYQRLIEAVQEETP